MNRSSFLCKLIGIAGIAVAPVSHRLDNFAEVIDKNGTAFIEVLLRKE